ncbi:MAG: DUF1566 domain-containing protein [Gammaproteobacteria bacterium]|nr:DUF1566 domain-containing protein [Gammaproteobacteria bacterium]MBU1819405.1 DUF1566 domain-containing protein [Gammaproteobacteria bacterium]
MHQSKLFIRLWLGVLAPCALAPALAAGPTGLLNDTGQNLCDNGAYVMQLCIDANSGDASTMPRQDGRFGRDQAPLNKVGGGAAGFDFTKVCMDGTLDCTTAADTSSSPASTAWACTKDNVTNLIWSLRIQPDIPWSYASSADYANVGHNDIGRCGFSTGWRLPTRSELMSITLLDGRSPVIDSDYFPGVGAQGFWSSDLYAPNPSRVWMVNFIDGRSYSVAGSVDGRLVRSGP